MNAKDGLAPVLHRLELTDMDEAAVVCRASFNDRLPWLAGRHTPEEDRWYFREQVFRACEVWGALNGTAMTGVIAFREGWIDQLYVLPGAQGRGIGTTLLGVARSTFSLLQLRTFQRNLKARRFYESRGFTLVDVSDGAENDEGEPDALYAWLRSGTTGSTLISQ
jgi:GNAT superfamily N-acetyltransferase